MVQRLLVFGFAIGEDRIILAAPDFDVAQSLAFEQAEGDMLIPINHCLLEWGDEVMQWNEGGTVH